jgi:DNA polymerase III epsilon subunit-like protein
MKKKKSSKNKKDKKGKAKRAPKVAAVAATEAFLEAVRADETTPADAAPALGERRSDSKGEEEQRKEVAPEGQAAKLQRKKERQEKRGYKELLVEAKEKKEKRGKKEKKKMKKVKEARKANRDDVSMTKEQESGNKRPRSESVDDGNAQQQQQQQQQQQHQPDQQTGQQQRDGATGKAAKKRRRTDGPLALELELRRLSQRFIRSIDIQSAILGLLTPRPNPPWLVISNLASVQRVVCVVLGGVSFAQFCSQSARTAMPFVYSTFKHAHTRNPGSQGRVWDHAQTILLTPLDKARRQELQRERESSSATPKFSSLMVSKEQLVANEYPTAEVEGQSDGWVDLDEALGPLDASADDKVLGVDCEMVRTSAGHELARISVVQSDGVIVMDEFVMPTNPIEDYVTEFSGITPALLEGVTTRVADVQDRLKHLMDSQTLLVGHSLENDLRAVKCTFTRVIDTALLYPRGKGSGMKHALRHLARLHLKRDIQQGGAAGHCSEEDAKAAIDLVLLRQQHGAPVGKNDDSELLFDTVIRENVRTVVVDTPRVVSSLSADVEHKGDLMVPHGGEGDDEVAQHICLEVSRDIGAQRSLIWAQFRAVTAATREVRAQETGAATTAVAGVGLSEDPENGMFAQRAIAPPIVEAMSATDAHIRSIHEAAPAGTLIVVSTFGSTDQVHAFHREKREQGNSWSYESEQQLIAEVDRARDAITMFCVK